MKDVRDWEESDLESIVRADQKETTTLVPGIIAE